MQREFVPFLQYEHEQGTEKGENPCCAPDEIIQFLIKNNECNYKIPFINLEAGSDESHSPTPSHPSVMATMPVQLPLLTMFTSENHTQRIRAK